MTYNTKTIYPAQEDRDGRKFTTTKQTDIAVELKKNEVLKLYNSYREADYSVNVSFQPPLATKSTDEKEGNDDKAEVVSLVSPFDVAKRLAKQGIEYRASLKIKSKGAYEDMKDVMKFVEAEGYEYNVNVTLKVNDETTTNINDPLSWTDEDNVFKVSPKTSTDDAEKLHQLYDTLNDKGYEVEITIKPKAPKSTDMDSENETFATQLSAYPDGTLVTFRLSDEKVQEFRRCYDRFKVKAD